LRVCFPPCAVQNVGGLGGFATKQRGKTAAKMPWFWRGRGAVLCPLRSNSKIPVPGFAKKRWRLRSIRSCFCWPRTASILSQSGRGNGKRMLPLQSGMTKRRPHCAALRPVRPNRRLPACGAEENPVQRENFPQIIIARIYSYWNRDSYRICVKSHSSSACRTVLTWRERAHACRRGGSCCNVTLAAVARKAGLAAYREGKTLTPSRF
jgi:hypothetical protein